ncbi:MAG TPA: host attachment protein [Alphaproteobacteria bacterium]|nr:host attachment protein [Alphaproteobacteria bacterium]
MKTVWVLVADSYRARLFNLPPHNGLLEIKDLFHSAARRQSHQLGTDKPGRSVESAMPHRHAVEKRTSPQEREMLKFVKEIGGLLEQKLPAFDSLYVIAPPHLLGRLRQKLPKAVRAKISEEIAKGVLEEPIGNLRIRLPR